ncbi:MULTISPECIES: CaiB/BaiF CoA-transferase family protein [unclassified Gordonia (in: high G+C Gram-positive bacteria)]|uniref:CaiB/BaiF CoA transferase family protein n=2 Tax=Gordonia TaxID=2053 RepID=UPI0010F906B4|nr:MULTISPECIES: CaiB/BaiF CoA-transferase family protein [unclassified Gordonia (in: high G+C Gram-positive bacteria)]
MSGPLAGVRVVEMPGLGPTPHACMLLADLGADVIRIRRPGPDLPGPDGIPDADAGLYRSRRTVDADVKDPDDVARIRDLIRRADIVVEGFRPGVVERLGLGPEICSDAPQLIYARMTGWGQDGDRAASAGHDINYLAVTGVLEAMGPAGAPPVPPLSLVGDFGGGSMLLVVGVLAALHDRTRTGRGQVIDAAMVDGAGLLGALQWSWKAAGRWGSRDQGNLLDGSAPFYATYRCADDKFVAVGALEEKFWRNLVDTLGLGDLPDRWDRAAWPVISAELQARFGSRTRDEWGSVFDGVDACVTPVLDFDEAAADPVAVQRGSFVRVDDAIAPAPAPRFSRTVLPAPSGPSAASLGEVVEEWSAGI